VIDCHREVHGAVVLVWQDGPAVPSGRGANYFQAQRWPSAICAAL